MPASISGKIDLKQLLINLKHNFLQVIIALCIKYPPRKNIATSGFNLNWKHEHCKRRERKRGTIKKDEQREE